MMLEDGTTSQGATHRTYDQYGKRLWVATATATDEKNHRHLGKPTIGGEMNVPSSQQRSKTF